MNRLQIFVLLFLVVFSVHCNQSLDQPIDLNFDQMMGRGILLTTRFNSFEEFKKEVQVEYKKGLRSSVRLTQNSNGQTISSILKSGVSETDFINARDGSFLDKVVLSFRSPYFVMQRKDMLRAFILSRRRHKTFGGGDVAFYDLAETMMKNIDQVDLMTIPSKDLSEKGFINTFNHVNAQALMTSIFSETLADFIADTHERSNMKELITGEFSAEQLADINNGPTDNYVDIINNEWGQELGKLLSKKYKIQIGMNWTPELLANYLNDMQQYYSWVFGIGFEPYRVEEEIVVRFASKINSVINDVSGLR